MAPHVEAFQASQLKHEIQYRPNGRLHKPPVDLKQCALKELIQYETELGGPQSDPKTKVVCQPVLRLFRQCANGLTVETTAWEGWHDRPTAQVVESKARDSPLATVGVDERMSKAVNGEVVVVRSREHDGQAGGERSVE